MSSSPLDVIWNLQYCPLNFECLYHFIQANEYRKNLGIEKMRLVIRKGRDRKFGTKDIYSFDENQHRLDNLLVPCTGLLPAFDGSPVEFEYDDYKPTGHTFPIDWDGPGHSNRTWIADHRRFWTKNMERLRAPRASLEWVDERLNGRAPIVVALRANSHSGWRNSSMEAWKDFERACVNRGRDIILLPDAMSPCGDEFVSRCSKRVQERAALYARARVVCGVAGGNMALALFMGLESVWFDTHVAGQDTSERCYKERGMVNLPGTTFAGMDSFEEIMNRMEPWLD